MAWITYAYACSECKHRLDSVLRDRKDSDLSTYTCPACGHGMHIAPHINPTKVSYPAGVRKHTTADLKERQALRKANRKAYRDRDKVGQEQIRHEMTKLPKA